jgi:protein-export membrane protein SecD
MFGTLKGRILVIVAVLAVSLGFLFTRGIKLGLDLQGGMHLALEVEDREGTFTPQIRAEYTDRAMQIIRNRIDQFGVEEPLIQKIGDTRIIVALAGIRDPQRAKDIVQRTAFLTFNLVGNGRDVVNALPRVDQVVSRAFPEEAARTKAAPGTRPRESVQDLLFKRPTADSARAPGDSTAAGDSASGLAAADTSDAGRPFSSKLLDAGADGEFMVAETEVEEMNRYLALPEVQRVLPRNVALRWAAAPEGRGASLYRRLYVLEERPFMTGENLEDAQAGRDPQMGFTTVSFRLNRRGGRVFERVTGQHIGDRIAIVLDNQVYSAPQVRGQIGSSGQIEMGQSPMTEARDLALVLRAGALPDQ